MFTLTDNPTYWWPVEVPMPSQSEAGKTEPVRFDAQFRHLGLEETEKLQGELGKTVTTDAQLVMRICTSWREVRDGHGNDLPFTEENVRRLLNVPHSMDAIYAAFKASRQGAAEKN